MACILHLVTPPLQRRSPFENLTHRQRRRVTELLRKAEEVVLQEKTISDSALFYCCLFGQAINPAPTSSTPQVQTFPVDNDITNMTIFVGGLDPNVMEDELSEGGACKPCGRRVVSSCRRKLLLVDGVTGIAVAAGAVPTMEQREKPFDPLAKPDVDKLNAAYLAVHQNAMLGRPLWLKTSALS